MTERARDRARVRWRWCVAPSAMSHLTFLVTLPDRQGMALGSTVLLTSAAVAAVGAAFGLVFERLHTAYQTRKQCEERYERAARGASDGLWEWETGSGQAYFSISFAKMLGLTQDELGTHLDGWLGRVHPDDLSDFQAAINGHLAGALPCLDHEHRLRRGAGDYLWVRVRGLATHRVNLPSLVTGFTTDISTRRSAEQDLPWHALRDPLTGLANRSLFTDRLRQAILLCREHCDMRMAVLSIDLDRFKRLNDSHGRAAGDALLREVTGRLRRCVRSEDTVARLGSNEFALLLQDVGSKDYAIAVAAQVRATLLEPAVLKGRVVASDCNIGIAVVDSADTTPAEVVRHAHLAMHRAKDLGPGYSAVFDPSMRTGAVERLTLEDELRRGLARGEFDVLYQPIVDAAFGFAGFEALPRWHHPRLGVLPPSAFIALAEETGLIMDLGALVMTQACVLGKRMSTRVPGGMWTVHVDLSAHEIQRFDIAARVQRVLDLTGLDPRRLCLEVTEDLVLDDAPTGGAFFEELRKLGIKLCMDDFGTGYSSLSYLHRFRVDFLKIETAFVHGAEHREGGIQIVRSLVNLAKNLGITAVAEGVETQRQWEILRSLGCPLSQGLYFAEPLTSDDLESWVCARTAASA